MRIMGIDASISSTGYAIYDTSINDFIEASKIRTSIKKATPTQQGRINQITMELSLLLLIKEVDVVLIEDIYVGMGQISSIIPLAILRGSIANMVEGLGYDALYVAESKKIKKEVVGSGNASKEDTYNVIKEKYKHSPVVKEVAGEELVSKNNKDKNEDIIDAIALIDSFLSNPEIVHPA